MVLGGLWERTKAYRKPVEVPRWSAQKRELERKIALSCDFSCKKIRKNSILLEKCKFYLRILLEKCNFAASKMMEKCNAYVIS